MNDYIIWRIESSAKVVIQQDFGFPWWLSIHQDDVATDIASTLVDEKELVFVICAPVRHLDCWVGALYLREEETPLACLSHTEFGVWVNRWDSARRTSVTASSNREPAGVSFRVILKILLFLLISLLALFALPAIEQKNTSSVSAICIGASQANA